MKTAIYVQRAQIVIGGLCLIPVILWLYHHRLEACASTSACLRSVGQIMGLVGTVLFSLNFLLATRFSWIEDAYGGLNRVYIAHHTLGAYAFIALIFHPLALGSQYIFVSWSLVLPFFLPSFTWSALPVWYGIIAFSSLCILLLLTFYGKLLYETWKLTHKLLGLSLFFASLHVYFIPSTVAYSLPLRIYMLTIVGVGLVAFVYTTLLRKWLASTAEYIIEAIVPRENDTLEIVMKPKEHQRPLFYRPGQFVFFRVQELGVATEEHPFSLISAPSSDMCSIAVKSLGDYTETLKLLRVGAPVQLEGPYGYFSYDRYSNHRQLWIAGGIGITPFLSMARSLTAADGYSVELRYVVRKETEAVFIDELRTIQAQLTNFKLMLYVSEKMGRLSTQTIATATADLLERDIFICGPPPMMESLKTGFKQLGKKGSQIHTEEFSIA